MKSVRNLSITALLIALGITIPIFMPKIIIPPASYTLASHVPLFVAMFISPSVVLAVAIGTGIGFFLSTPFIVAVRAFSHCVFALLGSLYIKNNPDFLSHKEKRIRFNIIIGIIHATLECLAVTPFFFSQSISTGSYFTVVFLAVGVGGFIHSLVDFTIASTILRRIPLK